VLIEIENDRGECFHRRPYFLGREDNEVGRCVIVDDIRLNDFRSPAGRELVHGTVVSRHAEHKRDAEVELVENGETSQDVTDAFLPGKGRSSVILVNREVRVDEAAPVPGAREIREM